MKLADLQLATELQGELARLEEFAGPGTLALDDKTIELSADDMAGFVEWRRQSLFGQLRDLGVDPRDEPGGEPGDTQERSGTAREAPSTRGERIAPGMVRTVGVQPAAPLTRAAALEEATRLVMGRIYDEWHAGELDDPGADDPRAAGDTTFAELKQRRQALIDAEVARLMTPERTKRCALCHLPSTTIVGGRALCESHAKEAPREEPLRLVR